MSQGKYYLRFKIGQRIEHWIMVISFTLLGFTGLIQKFAFIPWVGNLIAVSGGIEAVRVIHHYAAAVMIAGFIYHGAVVTYKVLVERVRMTMMPGIKDLTDMFGVIMHNLGLKADRPKLPRYNFEEKMEYWALIWGTVIMALTGLMLWNPITTAKFLPGSFIPAAKAAHGGEAILAVLAVLVWHMYSVHLRKFNKSMFTGKMSEEEMRHEHALELEDIAGGVADEARSTPEGRARRARIFIPIFAVITAVFLFGAYLFLTYEETAITTLPESVEPVEAYQPITVSEAGGSPHATITEYNGPESCTGSGCHTAKPLETVTASAHSRRIAAAGPNPLLAKMVKNGVTATQTPECLLCHAKDLNLNDPVASVQSVRAAGGQTCTRCHSGHTEDGVHAGIGLGCTSCHTSTEHQIESKVNCTTCHLEKPHTNPIINSKHERLDCLTCHTQEGKVVTVNTAQSTQDPVTGFYTAQIDFTAGDQVFAWQKDGQAAAVDTEGAIIVPVIPVTILTPNNFDPVDFAATGNGGSGMETVTQIVPGHNVTKEARTCGTCHGPEGTFDFTALGFNEEAGLSMAAAK